MTVRMPDPGDRITVLARSGAPVRVTVRQKMRYVRDGARADEWRVYSQRRERDGMLTGLVGTIERVEYGLTWARGWTTNEAKALAVKAALGG